MKATIPFLLLSAASLHGATVFRPAPNALASTSWDTFIFETPVVGDSGTHGSAQAISGAFISTSDLSSETIAAYDRPPGGFNFNPDTYYFHNGGGAWTVSAALTSGVEFVRVSYALLGFGGSAPEAFAEGPEIPGATSINSGSYSTGTSQVFFSDFNVATSTTEITATFGDSAIGQSFRSIDAVQLEFFSAVPVPEPSSLLMGVMVVGFFALRRKRASANSRSIYR